tara:strand:+ start:66 stop:383 length:318 start_codon:yes stop_codon:yes gene_type:complete
MPDPKKKVYNSIPMRNNQIDSLTKKSNFNSLKQYNQGVQRHNDSIKKVASKKFPPFYNRDKSESKDRAASINMARLKGAERFIKKNQKTKGKTSMYLEKITNYFN